MIFDVRNIFQFEGRILAAAVDELENVFESMSHGNDNDRKRKEATNLAYQCNHPKIRKKNQNTSAGGDFDVEFGRKHQ